ncbi:MAG: sigma-70 family RNA polymerase sigma factor [Planctomycetes bacterium]|nr:sigma-70 family RNA polymerase sigma factor [Planctomycetota bacterium]
MAGAIREQHVRRPVLVKNQSDEQLVAAYREGNEAALTILMRRYRGELMGFLTRLLGNVTAAEDVFQETFLQIHLSADTFDITRRFKPWLFTIAANKGRDHFRKHGKRAAAMTLSAPLKRGSGAADGPTFVDLLEAEIPDLDAPMEADERRQRVRQVVEAMPHNQREILVLAYFLRLSYNQIADTLDIPLGTVKSRLHSAVGSFADRWKRMENGDLTE